MAINPAERSMLASAAANTRWAFTNDRSTATGPARQAFNERFERIVDPDGELHPDERARRAANLRRAHMKRLALKSARSRRTAASARQAAAASTQAATELEREADDTDAELDELAEAAGITNRPALCARKRRGRPSRADRSGAPAAIGGQLPSADVRSDGRDPRCETA